MASIIVELMADAARAALATTSVTGEDVDIAISLMVKAASSSPGIQRKFAYATTMSSYIAGDATNATVVPGDESERSTVLPSLRLPKVVRIRQRKLKITINHVLPASFVQFMNESYAKDIEFDFQHILVHDHPEAAASKKVETEVVMMMLRAKGADFTHFPTNDYQFSVIDSGGDWRYHHVRKHVAIHVDAPFLDERDHARDTKKRMQLTSDADNAMHICREVSEVCMVSAPFMMSVHSSSYTTPILKMCETMAARGVLCHIGTMHLPESVGTMMGTYTDPHYGYVARIVPRQFAASGVYVPPHMRQGLGKYLFDDHTDLVQFRYPAGESREYVHERHILTEKLNPGTFMVVTAHKDVYNYQYRVVKRVGSLIYFEISYIEGKSPAHECVMATAHGTPKDAYRVTFDENLIGEFALRPMREAYIDIPRQLFTAVAAHCLVQVRSPSFSIEQAISYATSAAAGLEANGVVVFKSTEVDSYSMLLLAGAAAFFWAFDRMRLMEQRLPQLELADAQQDVQRSIAGKLGQNIGFGEVKRTVKEAVQSFLTDSVTSYLVTRTTSYADVRQLYESIATIGSPGLKYIRDLHECYMPLQVMETDGPHVKTRVSSEAVEAMIPAHPVYSLEPSLSVIKAREYLLRASKGELLEKPVESVDTALDGTTLASSIIPDVEQVRVVDDHDVRGSVTQITPQMMVGMVNAVPYIKDMITLSMAAEAERDQTAQQVYQRVFDAETRDISSYERLKGTVKGQPVVLKYHDGELIKIFTLAQVYHRGEQSFRDYLEMLVGSRCIYPEKVGIEIRFGTGVVKSDGILASDRRQRTNGQTFAALVDPSIKVLNSSRLRKLLQRVSDNPVVLDISQNQLRNEVAGSGKTYAQCVTYQEYRARPPGQRAAIFASTKRAAAQAIARLKAWGVDVVQFSISTVDSFLMDESHWARYALVMLDEALQLHPGKIMAVQDITGARIMGFGDRMQITYLPFTRYAQPSVDTDYKWASELKNETSRRIPRGKILLWLQDIRLYGGGFETLNPKPEALVFYACMSSVVDGLTVPVAYDIMGLSSKQPLLILVHLHHEADELGSKLRLSREMPQPDESGDYEQDYPACLCTVGESQGDDVPNVLLLMLRSTEEPLYSDKAQTIVAWTRHKSRFGFLRTTSAFPSLIETIGGPPAVVSSYKELRQRRMI